MSGGPVFVWRRGLIVNAELIGFIVEYQQNIDLLYMRAVGPRQIVEKRAPGERSGSIDRRLPAAKFARQTCARFAYLDPRPTRYVDTGSCE